MRLLVTGCAGFIGAGVTEAALAAGHEVVGVDNLNDAYDPRLKTWRLERLVERPRFRFERADVANRESIERAVQGSFDAILHLAARAGVRQSIANPDPYVETNVRGTMRVLEFARRRDVGRVVIASTSSLYGSHNPRPFLEGADTSRPLSPYAATKKGAEALGASYAHLFGMDVPVLRYFTVYGPAGRPDMSVFRFIRQIAEEEPIVVYGDGAQERDFTYVEDIARGTLLAAEKLRGHEVVNLGGDRPVSLSTMIGVLEKCLGKEARIERRPFHRADIPKTWASIEKARALLGWEPKVTLEEGLARAAQWYLDNRSWAREIKLEVEE